MTYRLMAQMASDAVCRKLRINADCITARTPLPGSLPGGLEKVARKIWEVPTTVQKAVVGRVGTRAATLSPEDDYAGALCANARKSLSPRSMPQSRGWMSTTLWTSVAGHASGWVPARASCVPAVQLEGWRKRLDVRQKQGLT